MNTLNYLGYNIIEMYIEVTNPEFRDDPIMKLWDTISLFWFDILNLTNGICFLMLFRSMANSKRKKKEGYLSNDTSY